MDIRQMTPLFVKDYTISMLNKVNSKMGYKLPKETLFRAKKSR